MKSRPIDSRRCKATVFRATRCENEAISDGLCPQHYADDEAARIALGIARVKTRHVVDAAKAVVRFAEWHEDKLNTPEWNAVLELKEAIKNLE